MAAFPADREDSLMLNPRQEHLQLLWPRHKDCYFQPMLEHGVPMQTELSDLSNAEYTSEVSVFAPK